MRWLRCAAVILATGSTSSTSGAEACSAPAPETAAAALSSLSADGRSLAYREEVSHPALAAPETARGLLWAEPDGSLVKAQDLPDPELATIGEDFIAVRRPPEAEANLLPIPGSARPAIEALRLVVAGDAARLAETYDAELEATDRGWTVRLDLSGQPFVLRGCGERLLEIELREDGGITRTYFLSPAE